MSKIFKDKWQQLVSGVLILVVGSVIGSVLNLPSKYIIQQSKAQALEVCEQRYATKTELNDLQTILQETNKNVRLILNALVNKGLK